MVEAKEPNRHDILRYFHPEMGSEEEWQKRCAESSVKLGAALQRGLQEVLEKEGRENKKRTR